MTDNFWSNYKDFMGDYVANASKAAGTSAQSIEDQVLSTAKSVSDSLRDFTIAPRQYQFSYDVFPEDLGSDYYGHWMTITAKVPSGSVSTPTGPSSTVNQSSFGRNTSAYAVGLFIPGAGEGGSGIIYEDKHEYTDIKLTNVMGKAIGAYAGGTVGEGGAVASMFGHPINPGVQVLYRSTNLRAFQFTFMMAPSSQKESEAMDRIIWNLRRFAAPDLNQGTSLLFDTPAEFEIKFFNKTQENLAIPRIRRCVLTDINVNYTPQGEWSTFRNGYPVSCLLSVAFQEMEIITRDKITNGYN